MNSGLFYFIKGNLRNEYESVYNTFNKHKILECIQNNIELSSEQYKIYSLLDYGVSHYIINSIIYMNTYSNFIKWKVDYIIMNYKDISLIFMQNRLAFLYRRAISNPAYRLCKKRLIREYNEISN